jgi:uncharacterized membrane protein YgcG
MKKIILFFAAISFFLIGASPILAQERVIEFQSDITINSDSSLLVTETITVEALGQEIKRGIYRDFPTIYQTGFFQSQVGFEVVSVKRDGADIKYSTENQSNGVRVYLGDMEVYIPEGIYTYELTYLTTGQLGYFEEHDELYWNVTGNGWIFPIEKASALVHLPAGIERDQQIRMDAFTGYAGSQIKGFESQIINGSPYFETMFTLRPEQGLTIVVGWPKGFVTEPTQQERNIALIIQNLGIIISLISLFLILVYFLWAWNKVGRDPNKQAIIAQYDPPRGFSPALMGYVYKMGYYPQLLTSSIISLAIKGYLKIEKDKHYKLLKLSENNDNLSEEQLKLVNEFFKKKNSLVIKQSNHQEIRSGSSEFQNSLAIQNKGKYFNYNSGYFLVGAFISLFITLISLMFLDFILMPTAYFILIWLIFWSIGITFLLIKLFSDWVNFLDEKSFANLGKFIFTFLVSIPFIAGEIIGIIIFSTTISFPHVLILLLFFVVNIVFLILLKAPTVEGRKIMDEIEGFKLFLSVTEKDRMNFHNPPEKTPELFEKFLPYALALNVQNKWAEQFNEVFNKLHEQGRDYHPGWYAGAFSASAIGGFSNSLSSSFGSAISSASTAPGSSSGFGGGGGSGGGGGGGGGGGF